MHVLIPPFPAKTLAIGKCEGVATLPSGKERQHDKRSPHRAEILAAVFPRIPLGQAEYLEEEDSKEEEQDEP